MDNLVLENCPFCGNSVKVDGWLSGGYFVQCDEAGCFNPVTPPCDSPAAAVELWNTRRSVPVGTPDSED